MTIRKIRKFFQKHKGKIITRIAAVIASSLLLQCALMAPPKAANGHQRFFFHEVWGYLMKGEEKEISGHEPFTDILYFGVTISAEGRIIGSSIRPELNYKGVRPRMHLVVFKLSDPMLLHLCLLKDEPARNNLLDGIAGSSLQFDGIQINFEMLRPEDGPAFLDLLSDLRLKIPGKVLSVAVPARLKKIENDAYDYSALSGVVDKIVVMAYDQHWKTSSPGPVASVSWCNSVADYATDTIPPEKLVMGLPLYGRAWPTTELRRSLKYRQIDEKLRQSNIRQKRNGADEPYLEYKQSVTVKVFYEDVSSIHAKLRLYKSYGISGVAFWRIGQGPDELWDTIFISRNQ
jgi:spore germination protein